MLDAQYDLEIAECSDAWRVVDARLNESLSALFSATVRATLSADSRPGASEEDLLGNDVTLVIRSVGMTRRVRGMVKRVSILEAVQTNVYMLDIEIVPALWLLTRVIDSRIYHDVTASAVVRDVVRRVLSVRSRNVRVNLSGEEPIHEYLVQYHETAYEFIHRICSREGISFHFDFESEDHEVLVLTNDNGGFAPIDSANAGAITYLPGVPGGRSLPGVLEVRREHVIGAFDGTVGGYNWTKPEGPVREAQTGRGLMEGVALEVYQPHEELHYHRYEGLVYGADTSERQAEHLTQRLDQARERWSLTTNSINARVGHRLKLVGATPAGFDTEFIVTGLHANGHGDIDNETQGSYEATLDVVPLRLTVRPPVAKRRYVHGPETGTVVAAHKGSREEIDTDEHGRILVRLHWDRDSSDRTSSSAWLRVTQAWAGTQWGALFIPRVGMEVVVQFLGGDPDRPFVSGCLYNKRNRPPVSLPEEKTKSTLKSNSSIGGNGYNQILFEDAAQRELIHVHAQKDLDTKILHNHTEFVGNDETMAVIKNRRRYVGVDEVVDIDRHQTLTVEQNQTITVEKGYRYTTLQTGHDTLVLEQGNRATRVEQGDDRHVVKTGSRFVDIGSNDTLTVKGDQTVTVTNGNQTVTVSSGNITIEATSGAIDIKAPEININGGSSVSISAASGLKLGCGGATVEFTPSLLTALAPLIKIN